MVPTEDNCRLRDAVEAFVRYIDKLMGASSEKLQTRRRGRLLTHPAIHRAYCGHHRRDEPPGGGWRDGYPEG